MIIKKFNISLLVLYLISINILCFILIISLKYISFSSYPFKKELQIFYHDIFIYKNFIKSNNLADVIKMRKKCKYRKIGYYGHPNNYIFSYPLDNKILISPVIDKIEILLLIFIHCRPEEFYERFLSRKYIIISNKSKVIYITSKSNIFEVNKRLKYESLLYKDILQFNEISSYFNLSIQTVHMILWSSKIDFKYLLKTDIDVYINTPFILNLIQNYNIKHKYYAMGKISLTYILRNKKYSHYVPKNIIKENLYPPYLQGVGYIIPCNTVQLLAKSIEHIEPKIWIEDVFMGYAYKYYNISLIDLSQYILRELTYNISYILQNITNYLLVHGFYPTELYILNKYISNKI